MLETLSQATQTYLSNPILLQTMAVGEVANYAVDYLLQDAKSNQQIGKMALQDESFRECLLGRWEGVDESTREQWRKIACNPGGSVDSCREKILALKVLQIVPTLFYITYVGEMVSFMRTATVIAVLAPYILESWSLEFNDKQDSEEFERVKKMTALVAQYALVGFVLNTRISLPSQYGVLARTLFPYFAVYSVEKIAQAFIAGSDIEGSPFMSCFGLLNLKAAPTDPFTDTCLKVGRVCMSKGWGPLGNRLWRSLSRSEGSNLYEKFLMIWDKGITDLVTNPSPNKDDMKWLAPVMCSLHSEKASKQQLRSWRDEASYYVKPSTHKWLVPLLEK